MGDQAGTNYINSAQREIGDRPQSQHIQQLALGDMEVFLCMEGYGMLYEATISPQKKASITAEKGTLEYWEQVTDAQIRNSKPQNAVAVIDEMEKRGVEYIPSQLRKIIESALTLASETA